MSKETVKVDDVDVDVDVHKAPTDMPGADPKEIERKWYWVMPNAGLDGRRTKEDGNGK